MMLVWSLWEQLQSILQDAAVARKQQLQLSPARGSRWGSNPPFPSPTRQQPTRCSALLLGTVPWFLLFLWTLYKCPLLAHEGTKGTRLSLPSRILVVFVQHSELRQLGDALACCKL